MVTKNCLFPCSFEHTRNFLWCTGVLRDENMYVLRFCTKLWLFALTLKWAFLCEFQPLHAVSVPFLRIWDHGSLFEQDVVCGPACLAYLVYSHSTPSPLFLWDSWKSTRVGSCRPGCGSGCALLSLFPGSAPWSRALRSSSCTGCRSRWRLSLHDRNRLFRGSGRSRWTAGWMKGRCWNNRNDHPQPKVRLRGRQRADSC